jgi:putative intracellular protease/amidase
MTSAQIPEAARQIGIVLFDDVEELDAVGPWEVLSAWTSSTPRTAGTPSASPPTAAPSAAPRP